MTESEVDGSTLIYDDDSDDESVCIEETWSEDECATLNLCIPFMFQDEWKTITQPIESTTFNDNLYINQVLYNIQLKIGNTILKINFFDAHDPSSMLMLVMPFLDSIGPITISLDSFHCYPDGPKSIDLTHPRMDKYSVHTRKTNSSQFQSLKDFGYILAFYQEREDRKEKKNMTKMANTKSLPVECVEIYKALLKFYSEDPQNFWDMDYPKMEIIIVHEDGVFSPKLSVEDLGELDGLTVGAALHLATIAYGVNSFSKPLEDLEGCMVKLLECLINPGYRLGIVTICSRFVVDGAPLLKIYVIGDLWIHGGLNNIIPFSGLERLPANETTLKMKLSNETVKP
eukprot:Gb_40223 [translate_table: standard]